MLLDGHLRVAAVARDGNDRLGHAEVRVHPTGEVSTAGAVVGAESLSAHPTHYCATAGVGHPSAVLRAVDEQLRAVQLLGELVAAELSGAVA